MKSLILPHLSRGNFFVPLLSDDKTLEENQKISEFKLDNFNAVMREQFQLAYHGKIEYAASDDMLILERRTMYRILVEQKQDEKKAQEEAIKAAEAKRKAGAWKSRRRR